MIVSLIFVVVVVFILFSTSQLPVSLIMEERKTKKISPHAVTGKILTMSVETGERIGQWGGTECYLSYQRTLGPCLVVRSSKHKKGDGTFFLLQNMHRLFSSFVHQGKLSIVVRHGGAGNLVTVHIQTLHDMEELWEMFSILRDRKRWSSIEKNVGCRGWNKRGRGEATESSIRDPLVMSSMPTYSRAAEDEEGEQMEPPFRVGRSSLGRSEEGIRNSGDGDDTDRSVTSAPSSFAGALPWE